MYIYVAIIATVQSVALRHMDSAAALISNNYGLESLLAEHLVKGSAHWKGAQHVNVWGSVHWERV